MLPALPLLPPLRARAEAAAGLLRLPLRQRAWKGRAGGWLGNGTGSSIDFQDHRPYLPGDDPRAIDWQAYARSGHYTMKLYREEVSPCVDIALDASASLFFTEAKAARTLELFYFALCGAVRARAAVRCYLVCGERIHPQPPEAILAPGAPPWLELLAHAPVPEPPPPPLEQIPWRNGSLRLWVSDLLFPGAPSLSALVRAKGRGIVLAPRCRQESDPAWEGNLELIDCETGARRRQRVPADLRAAYLRAYAAHWAQWRGEARRMGIALAAVDAEPELLSALRAEALPQGALEVA